jgi:hypothetical protein
MKNKKLLASLGFALALSNVAQAVVDTRDSSSPGPGTTYFIPVGPSPSSSPYWRGASQDWEWQHNAIAGTITSATLNVSAWDVDYSLGERDGIYGYDAATTSWLFLGYLAGADSVFSFTNFGLGAALLDDIGTGLKVKIDIDMGPAAGGTTGWLVTLSKSVLTTENENPGNPNPTVPDHSSTMVLMGMVGMALAGYRRFLA